MLSTAGLQSGSIIHLSKFCPSPMPANQGIRLKFYEVDILPVAGVGGKSVRQADVSGGTLFPRKLCPTGQDILSVLGYVRG